MSAAASGGDRAKGPPGLLGRAPRPLEAYKRFVRDNASLVVNLERLAHWVAWSPDRFHGSEFAYEAFNAAVGLLGLYNESVMEEDDPAAGAQSDWGFALAAVEQVRARGARGPPGARALGCTRPPARRGAPRAHAGRMAARRPRAPRR
jgi:hypothetical protein